MPEVSQRPMIMADSRQFRSDRAMEFSCIPLHRFLAARLHFNERDNRVTLFRARSG
jgi:hypothetical protein